MKARLQIRNPELNSSVLHRGCRDGGQNSKLETRNSKLKNPLPASRDPHSELPALPAIDPPPAVHSLGEGGSSAIHPLIPRPRTRNGKIACLPYLERDMVNRMLRNNIAYLNIREALEEHGLRVTERNISNWKTRGGYKEWCAEQNRALETRLQQDNLLEHLRKNDASQIPEVGLQLAATRLSQFLLSPQAEQQLTADPQAYVRNVTTLCRLTSQIHNLQKYRDTSAKELGSAHNPERLKREEEKHVEETRNVYSAAKLGDTDDEPDLPHRNYLPKM